ncbi:MAG: chorismate synthase, partial [Alistipes sp.]|nr:chorismate synthase [Alistipes sp.]
HNDPRGGGHFSGRLTLGLVAAAVVAKKILGDNVQFSTNIIEIGGEQDSTKFDQIIEQARMSQDSVGGVVECRTNGIEAGLGEPFFDSAESLIAHLLFSVPAVKGVEFGDGFTSARMLGSQNNDPITDADGHTATNHAGGIVGGITNGNEIVVRAAIKPTASISREQQTFNFESGKVEPLIIKGRHDVCIALRAAVVVEAAVAIALADLKIRA